MLRILTVIFNVILFHAFIVASVLAQEFQFQREVDTIPVIINDSALQSPFAGGFSSSKPTFADIDNDGDFDLFVGTGPGNIHFYRNTGTVTDPNFTLETENLAAIDVGSNSAPTFADIDNDEDFDLFVGESDGNINFYRNIGTVTDPNFTLETEFFASIDVGFASTPTFADIDNDGDLDLFVGESVLFVLKLNFYRNTGTATNPIFTFETEDFAPNETGLRGTPTFADIDNDGDLDLFVGENLGNINFFRNIGTVTTPNFAFLTEFFASIDVGLDSSPSFADIDGDGNLDLFVGTGSGNIEFYRNIGSATDPNFTLETETFASIDVGLFSAPMFADIDNDGDFDLFVGERDGNINFFRNTGTVAEPNFILETENLADIDVGSNSAPTFTDIDNDGDFDLFVGERDGNINFFRNIGTVAEPNFTLETEFFASIDVGSNSAPIFADIDNDGDFDLFVGENFGNLNFYQNTGTATDPNFTLETEFFASIDVGFASTPTFADIDNDGDLDLFMGDEDGNINFYRNTGTVTEPTFTPESEDFATIDVGLFSVPIFADIDNDGDLDLFVGEGDSNINFYGNVGPATEPIFIFATLNLGFLDVGTESAPTFADIDNDGDLDLFVGETDGNINFYRNIGTAVNPTFIFVTENFASIDIGFESAPTFADIDNDGDFDLFVGERGRNINFYQNTGTATNPNFTLETEFFVSLPRGGDGTPTFADIDNDRDLDLFVGENTSAFALGNINFYRNTGTVTEPSFTLETANLLAIDVGSESTPAFADIDTDGDFDLFVGENLGKIDFYRNTGTVTDAAFSLEIENFASIDVAGFSTPTFADIDNDGDLDLFVGRLDGGLHFYRNVTPTSVSSPESEGLPEVFALSQNYPNPFNPETTIQYQLPKSSQVKLIIYNLIGQGVSTLVEEKQSPGFYSVRWNGTDDHGRNASSGIYLYRLETKEFVKVRKLTLVR